MSKAISKSKIFAALSELYTEMEAAYNLAANAIGLSCEGCPDNCCKTFFQHHTYIEWDFLWEGMNQLPDHKRKVFITRAQDYVSQSQKLLEAGKKPQLMCPLNENGLCQLYDHRLMICRMHGVPNSFVRPDGKKLDFPGCMPCQQRYASSDKVPVLDRTPHYRKLAGLEMAFRGPTPERLSRVNLTMAEMLVTGPPQM
jgi:hypothetical protein